jgi:hypothetical protein
MRHLMLGAAAAALFAGATAAHAERLYGLTFDNRIVTFDSANPEAIQTTRSISGLAPGVLLVGLDVRPANGLLYTLSSTGTVYELMLTGGGYVATAKSNLSTAPSGSAYGFDFNPVPDRLRLISDTGQNLRINVDTGAAIVDGMISSSTGPAMITGAAYTNSVAGASSTILYALDAAADSLLRSTNPNAGTYVGTNLMGEAFGPLGFGFTTANAVGFDISGKTGAAFANIDSLLWSIDLVTGQGSSLGIVGAGPLRSIATGVTGGVPEPATWALFIAGFGLVGATLRQRRAGRLQPA